MRCGVFVLFGGLLVSGCGSDPQSPQHASSVSGTVVFDQTGAPAEGVDVTFERCAGGTMMMMGNEWEHSQDMMTDSHGRFHFEYVHDPVHRYRVSVRGSGPDSMCYLDGGEEDGVVLRTAAQDP